MDLDRLAEEELLREAKRAVQRSEISGIEGFKKCPLPQTNKRFLVNTILNNIQSNKIREAQNEKSKRKATSSDISRIKKQKTVSKSIIDSKGSKTKVNK